MFLFTETSKTSASILLQGKNERCDFLQGKNSEFHSAGAYLWASQHLHLAQNEADRL